MHTHTHTHTHTRLAYCMHPKDSGSVHSDIKARFDQGDAEVHAAMRKFAAIADEAKSALLSGQASTRLPDLLDANMDTRRTLYGDAILRPHNLTMLAIARKWGHAATFSGSGGCLVGMWHARAAAHLPEGEGRKEGNTAHMVRELQGEGFVFTWIHPIKGA
jgi:glucuronokinase